jgi:NAD(P)H-hydrate epimerase
MKVVTAEEMRQIDSTADGLGIKTEFLMENAGRSVAEETRKNLGRVIGKQILVVIGPGNNGGDGLVAARYLADWGADVGLYLCSKRQSGDKNLILTQEHDIYTIKAEEDKDFEVLNQWLVSCDMVVDAIFGTGKSRVIEGLYKQVLSKIRDAKEKRTNMYVIAVDIPSGLDADTGVVDVSCPRVDMTVTLGYPKPGLYNFPGADKVGDVVIVDIGIPPHLSENIQTELITQDWVQTVLPHRPRRANKGTFGKVLVIAGSINYIGAAYLACMGAARVGAGLVTLATARSLQGILAAKLTEVTYLPLPEAEEGVISLEATSIIGESLEEYDVVLMGCGLGQKQSVADFTKRVLFDSPNTGSPSLVLDADALNITVSVPDWWQKLSQDAILTPHPGEMARLTGLSLEEVLRNKLELARKMAINWGKVVVLKGAFTVIASPDGLARISQLANPGLASAGTGDVLAGVIAGLTAQGVSLFDAAACGVYLHGQAGEVIKGELGDTGMLASDLLPALPRVIMKLRSGKNT